MALRVFISRSLSIFASGLILYDLDHTMVSNGDLEAVEKIINYHFRSKALLSEALTAAGADSENYDGNRKLADIGADMIDFWVSLDGLKEQDRGKNRYISNIVHGSWQPRSDHGFEAEFEKIQSSRLGCPTDYD